MFLLEIILADEHRHNLYSEYTALQCCLAGGCVCVCMCVYVYIYIHMNTPAPPQAPAVLLDGEPRRSAAHSQQGQPWGLQLLPAAPGTEPKPAGSSRCHWSRPLPGIWTRQRKQLQGEHLLNSLGAFAGAR